MDKVIMEYVKRARQRYNNAISKPKRYQGNREVEIAQAELMQIESLAVELGLIPSGTI